MVNSAGGGCGERGVWGGFYSYVLEMRQPLQEHGAWGLFDVEIGQFDSVSFNFSQLTGPHWVTLIGYKLVLGLSFFLSYSSSFEPPPLPPPPSPPDPEHVTKVPLFIFLHPFLSLNKRSCSFTR